MKNVKSDEFFQLSLLQMKNVKPDEFFELFLCFRIILLFRFKMLNLIRFSNYSLPLMKNVKPDEFFQLFLCLCYFLMLLFSNIYSMAGPMQQLWKCRF